MNDKPETTCPYRVTLYRVGREEAGKCVEGPGLGGWQGIIPRSHDGMTQKAAEELADLLNRAYALGQADRARAIGRLIGG